MAELLFFDSFVSNLATVSHMFHDSIEPFLRSTVFLVQDRAERTSLAPRSGISVVGVVYPAEIDVFVSLYERISFELCHNNEESARMT